MPKISEWKDTTQSVHNLTIEQCQQAIQSAQQKGQIVSNSHGLSASFEKLHCQEGTDIDTRGRARMNVRDAGALLQPMLVFPHVQSLQPTS